MIGLNIPTTLDWNGPIVAVSGNPSNVSVATSNYVSFSAAGTASFPEGQTMFATNTGSVGYQWYDQNGIVEDQNRTNLDPDTTTSVIAGAATSVLSITNAQYQSDNGRNFYCKIDYIHSAYGTSDPIVAGTARSTGNAINEPLNTTIASLDIKTFISITLQPAEQLDASTEEFETFNITAETIVDTDDTLLTYQWRLDEVNISNSANATGATTNTLQIKAAEGTHTIDCIVSHVNASPGSVTSEQVSYVTVDPRRTLSVEEIDNSYVNPNNANAPMDAPRVWTSSSNLNDGPVNLRGRPLEFPNDNNPDLPASRLIFVYAPEQDLDVVVEMASAGGQRFQVGSGDVQGGQGGWGAFRMTLKHNEEYSFKLGPNDGSFGPTGGLVTGTPIDGGAGGGIAVMYRGNKAIAVLGAGGGAGRIAAGGDGGGFGQPGENGFGRSGGGKATTTSPQSGSGTPRNDGSSDQPGALGACPNPPDTFQNPSIPNWMAENGISECEPYTQSGHFVAAAGSERGVANPQTALLKRGFRTGLGGRHNGAWVIYGGRGGGGGSGAGGGWSSRGNGNGGGGGSGWADPGEVTVLNTRPGVNGGDAYARILLYDPDEPIPIPQQPSPPTFRGVDWNDGRAPGWKWGTYGVGGDDQTIPGQYVSGPRGLQPNPSHRRGWTGNFSNHRSGPGGSGMYFAQNDNEGEDISYITFYFNFRNFGPRSEDMYLHSNHFYGVNGSTRKRWTRYQSVVDRHPDRYTTSKSEAWVPFRLDFFMICLCSSGGNYRVLEHTWSWDYDYYHRKTLTFEASELGRANGINPDGSGRLYFPDAGSGSGTTRVNYGYPRIHTLQSRIWNKDTRSYDNINMYCTADTDTNGARESNWFEFGRSIIT